MIKSKSLDYDMIVAVYRIWIVRFILLIINWPWKSIINDDYLDKMIEINRFKAHTHILGSSRLNRILICFLFYTCLSFYFFETQQKHNTNTCVFYLFVYLCLVLFVIINLFVFSFHIIIFFSKFYDYFPFYIITYCMCLFLFLFQCSQKDSVILVNINFLQKLVAIVGYQHKQRL